MNEETPQIQTNSFQAALSVLVSDLGWFVLQLAGRALLVYFGWNLLATSTFSVPQLTFGHAFVLVVVIKVLFSNLDGHSKYQTRHLYDLNNNIKSLIINQAYQNNSILKLLADWHGRNVPADERFTTVSLDEDEQTNYNERPTENNKDENE